MSLTTLLLLADSRLPAGGHAHSGGVEAAAASVRVHDVDSLGAFLLGRLHTVGLVAAAFASATAHRLVDQGLIVVDPRSNHYHKSLIGELEAGLDARTPSAAQRKASRTQGRSLLRAGRALWTLPALELTEPHHPVALGVVASAAGLTPAEAALAAAYGSVSGPASAAIRILALDPYPVYALLARLAPECDAVASNGAGYADADIEELPAMSAPLLDIGAELHATWEVRLFAS